MKSTTFSTLVLSIMTAAGTSFGHGTVDVFTADGIKYPGPLNVNITFGAGYTPPADSATRQIYMLEPLFSTPEGLSNINMTCGPSASSSAKTIAPVTAGSNVSFHFRSGNPGSPWPHDTGPILTYMYRCPANTNADKCLPGPNEKGWFKIDQQGKDGKGIWAQAAMMQNESISVPIPSNIPNGDYLVRHEIIALHNAVILGKAEFYISCTQVRVKGGSTDDSALSGAVMVAFPGTYKTDDPGLYKPQDSYTFPGPPVFASNASHSDTPSPSPSPTKTESNEGTSTPSTGVPLSSAASASQPRCTRTSASLPTTPASTPSATQSTTPGQCERKVSKRALRLRRRMLQGRFNPRPLRA